MWSNSLLLVLSSVPFLSIPNFHVSESEANVYQSQRGISWRANLLCFTRPLRGKIFIHTSLRLQKGFLSSFFLNYSSFWRLIMSAMKDITNYFNSNMQDSHESSPERDIFVSYEAPSSRSRRKRTAKQASLQKIKKLSTETLGDASNGDDMSNKSESEAEVEAKSVFMTPESEPKQKGNAQKRKRLRLGGGARNTEPALSVTLNGLSKAQLVDMVNTLVSERHPDLEQVTIALYVCNIRAQNRKENFEHGGRHWQQWRLHVIYCYVIVMLIGFLKCFDA